MPTAYVNCSSTGGDGTTNGESGATAAYASLSSWEANENGALSGIHQVYCDIGSTDTDGDTTVLQINGWSGNSASNFIRIEPNPTGSGGSGNDQRHAGTFDTSKYFFSEGSGSLSFDIREAYTEVIGLQLESTRNGSATILFFGSGAPALARKCLVRHSGTGGGTGNKGIGTNFSNNDVQVDNCAVWYEATSGTAEHGIAQLKSTGAVGKFYVACCTVENYDVGYYNVQNDGLLMINCIAASCTTAAGDDGTGDYASGTDYNMTNNASMGYTVTGGAPSNDQTSATLGFADQTNHDFHITASSTADGNGTATFTGATYSITEDWEGVTRSADIGCDELVAAATGKGSFMTLLGVQ